VSSLGCEIGNGDEDEDQDTHSIWAYIDCVFGALLLLVVHSQDLPLPHGLRASLRLANCRLSTTFGIIKFSK